MKIEFVRGEIIVNKLEEGCLNDYKFFCFDGVVKLFKIDFDRYSGHHANYYNRKGELLYFGEKVCPPDFKRKLEIPSNLNEMIALAEKLSEETMFSRVDFYNVNLRIYFGEITFFPASGLGEFTDSEWDKILGSYINL